jgi:16S rRNA C967 or C1407 C5-methylase (RsmB/RsmF family)
VFCPVVFDALGWMGVDGLIVHFVCRLQLRILQRAMKMLKEEGRIVYSTCSMNPVENEAVIAAALQSNPGKRFTLVPLCQFLLAHPYHI